MQPNLLENGGIGPLVFAKLSPSSGFLGWPTRLTWKCNRNSKHQPQIYKGDPRPRIPPCVMASLAMGLKLGSFGILPTTHTKANTKLMCPLSSCAVQYFMCVLSSRSDRSGCRWYMHLTNRGYFDYGKNLKTPNLSPMTG